MKTKYYLLLAISLVLVVAYSCRKDLVNEMPVKPETVQWAKDHFNAVLAVNNGSFVKIASTSASTTSNQKPNKKTPWWGRATASKTNLFDFVEVPLFYTRKVITLISRKDDPIDMEIAKASFDRLIVFKDKKGNIDQRIVSFIPDKDYLRKHDGDISHNKIDKLDKDFTGYLLYKNWEGKIVNKLRIINGKAKSFSKKTSAISAPIKLNKVASRASNTVLSSPGYQGQPGCTDWYTVTYTTFCYYEGDNPTPLYCDAPEITDMEYTRTECPSDPGDDEGCADPANFNNPECNGGGTEETCGDVEEEVMATPISIDVNEMPVSSSTTERVKIYEWKFLQNAMGMWNYTSKEKGTHKKVGSEWHWDKLEHLSIGRNGVVAVASISVENVNFIPVVGTYVAGGTIHFNYSSSFICKGIPVALSSNLQANSPVWNSNTP